MRDVQLSYVTHVIRSRGKHKRFQRPLNESGARTRERVIFQELCWETLVVAASLYGDGDKHVKEDFKRGRFRRMLFVSPQARQKHRETATTALAEHVQVYIRLIVNRSWSLTLRRGSREATLDKMRRLCFVPAVPCWYVVCYAAQLVVELTFTVLIRDAVDM